MPSIKDLRKRISSTKNTQQTTKAMKMVSAAKLRRSQMAITHQRPHARGIAEMIVMLNSMGSTEFKSPLLEKPELGVDQKENVLLVLISSDRGLCGGFNGNVIKKAQQWIVANRDQYGEIKLAFIGKRAADFFKRRGYEAAFFAEFGSKANFIVARELNQFLIAQYKEKRFQKIIFVFNEFKNAITQNVVFEQFLPLPNPEDVIPKKPGVEDASGAISSSYIVKPSVGTLLEELIEKHFATQVFKAFLESQASEHGARMSAMENATKNAGDMIRKLTLQYNKQRQAAITKELMEIIGGSESQKEQST